MEGRRLPESAARLAELIGAYREFVEPPPGRRDVVVPPDAGGGRSLGRARKVSVSLPEDLTKAVQERVGRGAFSQYVSDAVARQLELDLLTELVDRMEREHGAPSESLLAEAGRAWPDRE
ncbi:hypothetical protein ACL03H_12310 [Saccharopolyspora sp. MS10]|uniref:hypothetical protein n=1 Tax=Saccharopolyspora sp. MS10 TaxID=3385973 RepID=UPI00399FCD50